VPTAVTLVVLALQAVAYQDVLSTADGMSGLVQVLVMTGLTCLFLFHAIFSMGRSLGLRWRKRR
jgi:succinate dehydrogenase/fumarate reductase cytochrome b subunit